MADVFGIGVAVSVPVILWFRWHRPDQKRRRREDEDSTSGFHYSRTILGLQDYSPPPPPPPPIQRVTEPKESITVEKPAVMQPPVSQPIGWLERTLPKQSEPAEAQIRNEAPVMENMNILSINSQPQTSTPQPETAQPATPQTFGTHQPSPEPAMSQPFTPQPSAAPQSLPTQPAAYQPMSGQPPTQERPNVPTMTFRDQLFALNNSWQRIESTGKEVEDWFQRQQRLVMAHMERPSGKGPDSHMDLSHDFLEQRMNRVDAEWAAIRQTVREIHRWLENGSPEREVPQETKVW